MKVVDEKDNRAAAVRTARLTCRRRGAALCHRPFKLLLARSARDNLFEKTGSNRLTVNFEHELILAQTVDELPLLIDDYQARLHEFRSDSYRLVDRFLLLLRKDDRRRKG